MIEIPRSRSICIQSETADCRPRLAFTAPASWMAPPYRRSFSVSVVFPASGWLMMAKVLRFSISAFSRKTSSSMTSARVAQAADDVPSRSTPATPPHFSGAGRRRLYSLMSAFVLESWLEISPADAFSSGSIFFASCLPSSTPH